MCLQKTLFLTVIHDGKKGQKNIIELVTIPDSGEARKPSPALGPAFECSWWSLHGKHSAPLQNWSGPKSPGRLSLWVCPQAAVWFQWCIQMWQLCCRGTRAHLERLRSGKSLGAKPWPLTEGRILFSCVSFSNSLASDLWRAFWTDPAPFMGP